MSSLLELQTAFRDALWQEGEREAAFLAGVTEAPEIARGRLAAYRRSVLGRLMDAVEVTYPVVLELVGRPFLREAARQFALGHPSRSGDLNDYGAEFGDFLATYPHAENLPWLADVARLEWRVQWVAQAPDVAGLDMGNLATLPVDDWSSLRFELPAHALRFDSPWAVGQIWRMHLDPTLPAPDDPATPCRLLIWRSEGRVYVDELPAGSAALVDTLHEGQSLGVALMRAAAEDGSFDPAILGVLVAQGVLTIRCRSATADKAIA